MRPSVIEKIRTAIWFAKRPSHWAHGVALAQRKFLADHDNPSDRAKARNWAAERAVPVADALAQLGLAGETCPISSALMAEAGGLAERASVKMGGAGDLDLLHNAVRLSGATRVIETGVAYGWSSLAILAAMEGAGKLVSVDMPYPKMGNEAFVGIVVPERMRADWTLIREPDRRGLEKAIARIGGTIDLCHYDSDKSWWGRDYAFPMLWSSLKVGGIFISDDIQDNMYFSDFVAKKGMRFCVTESAGKYVGIMKKLS